MKKSPSLLAPALSLSLFTGCSFALKNTMEMSTALQSENVNVLVETDGTEQWQIESISSHFAYATI